MSRGFDVASLIAGASVILMGTLLVLDQNGSLELSLGFVAALLAGVLGAVLLASGLFDPGHEPSPQSRPNERDDP